MTETEACRKVLEERLDTINEEIERLAEEARNEDVLVELSDLLDRKAIEEAKRNLLESILDDLEFRAECHMNGMVPKRDEVRYINGTPVKSRHFAYDGCHKIYLLEEAQVKEAKRGGYCVLDIELLPDVWVGTCPLRFIDTWEPITPIVGQFEEAEFGDGWDISEETRARLENMERGQE